MTAHLDPRDRREDCGHIGSGYVQRLGARAASPSESSQLTPPSATATYSVPVVVVSCPRRAVRGAFICLALSENGVSESPFYSKGLTSTALFHI